MSTKESDDTANAHSGRLELTWANKSERLIGREDGSYDWVPRSDFRVAEVRMLHDAGEVGETRPVERRAEDNLLVRGDALSALTALVDLPEFSSEYVGRVKLAYLDPPFNTLQSFLDYDDSLEHSVWLTMMRDRLEQISTLLSEDGSVWVHCDDYEQAYLKICMDEIFGRDNFVATVIWEKADSPRNSARQFSTDHDYLLVYSREPEWTPSRLPRTEEANSIYANPDDDPRGDWIAGDPYANKPYSKGEYEIEGPTGRVFAPPPGRYWRIAEARFWELHGDGRIWWGPKGEARPSIKRYVSEVADLVPRTLWRRDDVGSNRTSKNEIRALFPGSASFATPKPEALLERVLRIGSEHGDIVLDCFLGSGTTAAVAQKMNRRWVGVEWSKSVVEDFALPRLTKVVRGDDPGGITEGVGWAGGGGFRVLDVGPSMFEDDEGVTVLADWATNGKLAQATAAQLRFTPDDDRPFCGRKGKHRLVVVDGLVSEDVVDLVVGRLGEGELLTLCGTSVDPGATKRLKDARPGSNTKKIPASLLADYQKSERWRPENRVAAGPPDSGAIQQ